MPKLIDAVPGGFLRRIVYSPFESNVLNAIRAAKREKNLHKVNTLNKMIDYSEIYRYLSKLK